MNFHVLQWEGHMHMPVCSFVTRPFWIIGHQQLVHLYARSLASEVLHRITGLACFASGSITDTITPGESGFGLRPPTSGSCYAHVRPCSPSLYCFLKSHLHLASVCAGLWWFTMFTSRLQLRCWRRTLLTVVPSTGPPSSLTATRARPQALLTLSLQTRQQSARPCSSQAQICWGAL